MHVVVVTLGLEFVRDTYLYQHVKQATRYRGDNQPSLLDLILTNEEEMIDNVVHNAPLGNSDRFAHRYIIFICT
jgi:hypothetical protein